MPPNPSDPGASAVGTTRAPTTYASWGERVRATLIEMGLLIAAALVVAVPLLAVPEPSGTVLVGLLVALYLYWQFQNGSSGQSPGKALLGLKVVSLSTEQPIGGARGLLRYGVAVVLAFFSCGLLGLIDYLYPLRDGRRQTLHDKAVNSVVLSGQPRRQLADLLRIGG